jgi:hypothetical protein
MIFTPAAASTSALPHCEETERLPCFATRTPAPAATNAAAVETLNERERSPPVPQVSTTIPAGAVNFVTFRRMARANPAISSTVSPLSRKPVMNAEI